MKPQVRPSNRPPQPPTVKPEEKLADVIHIRRSTSELRATDKEYLVWDGKIVSILRKGQLIKHKGFA